MNKSRRGGGCGSYAAAAAVTTPRPLAGCAAKSHQTPRIDAADEDGRLTLLFVAANVTLFLSYNVLLLGDSIQQLVRSTSITP